MRKILPWFFIITLILTAGIPNPDKLVRLTILNKSQYPLGIKLTGDNEANFYYLHVPKGDEEFPLEKRFTIARDIYQMQIYYIELWDPVYGTNCGSGRSGTIDAMHNTRMIVQDCTRSQGRERSREPETTRLDHQNRTRY